MSGLQIKGERIDLDGGPILTTQVTRILLSHTYIILTFYTQLLFDSNSTLTMHFSILLPSVLAGLAPIVVSLPIGDASQQDLSSFVKRMGPEIGTSVKPSHNPLNQERARHLQQKNQLQFHQKGADENWKAVQEKLTWNHKIPAKSANALVTNGVQYTADSANQLGKATIDHFQGKPGAGERMQKHASDTVSHGLKTAFVAAPVAALSHTANVASMPSTLGPHLAATAGHKAMETKIKTEKCIGAHCAMVGDIVKSVQGH
jgi:hypothetical protein